MTGRIIVVVAQSARLLAQMAVNSGWLPIAVDCFADIDTRRLALECQCVASLAEEDLMPVLHDIAKRYGLRRLIYGSGFEVHANVLVKIAQHWQILGNSPEVFQSFQDKPMFFKNLNALAIVYPETTFNPPVTMGPWLQKSYAGEGGMQITYFQASAGREADRFYWQRWLPGVTGSVTFLASEQNVKILGFNRQWVDDQDLDRPFMFSGICNQVRFSRLHCKILHDILLRLWSIYPLRGLGSLDFIISDGTCYVLEINARVPASAQLYDKIVFDEHIRAVSGLQAFGQKYHHKPRGYQIVVAPRDGVIPIGFDWPDWVVDIPADGAIIHQGQPICSIIAGGKNSHHVQARLQQRRTFIQNILFTGC